MKENAKKIEEWEKLRRFEKIEKLKEIEKGRENRVEKEDRIKTAETKSKNWKIWRVRKDKTVRESPTLPDVQMEKEERNEYEQKIVPIIKPSKITIGAGNTEDYIPKIENLIPATVEGGRDPGGTRVTLKQASSSVYTEGDPPMGYTGGAIGVGSGPTLPPSPDTIIIKGKKSTFKNKSIHSYLNKNITTTDQNNSARKKVPVQVVRSFKTTKKKQQPKNTADDQILNECTTIKNYFKPVSLNIITTPANRREPRFTRNEISTHLRGPTVTPLPLNQLPQAQFSPENENERKVDTTTTWCELTSASTEVQGGSESEPSCQ